MNRDKSQLIVSDPELKRFSQKIQTQDVFAMDTEFVGEDSYFPKLALIQIAYSDGVALLDPLVLSPELLADFFENAGTCIMHAVDQDLKILNNFCGAVPKKVFDLQVAAGFLGMGHPSLWELVRVQVGIELPKEARLSDWLQRPLQKEQIKYAEADVVHLISIYDTFLQELIKRDRLMWAEEESDRIRIRSLDVSAPDQAWMKIKSVNRLKGQSLGLAKELSAWREEKAKTQNRPKRSLLSDAAIGIIAQSKPRTREDLLNLRGLEKRFSNRPRFVREILEVINHGLKNPERLNNTSRAKVKNGVIETVKNRPTLNLLLAWLNAYAVDLDIYPPLLATRTDVLEFFTNPSHGRLTEGWRSELLSKPLSSLAAGKASVALDKTGKLILEERSAKPLVL